MRFAGEIPRVIFRLARLYTIEYPASKVRTRRFVMDKALAPDSIKTGLETDLLHEI